ncbi:hypothetical protein FRC07_005160 [Ceratobasidium sp. 392]|nr:hypothetical protein FRC07_005160 [Ceratobasidium sp. 392]
MSTPPAGFTLNAIAPTQVNRFATPVHLPTSRNFSSALSVARNAGAASAITAGNHLVHPEGSLIHSDEKLVSCQPITSTHKSLCAQIISHCSDLISRARFTVFVELKGRSQANYYIAVHESKRITWVDNQYPELLVRATPTKHNHEYWIHMENFPGPVFSFPEDRQNLVNVLASSAVDASTSDGSTCPMSIEQIDTNLKMLSSFGDDVDINQTYAIARLWTMLLQSRVINHYGTPQARLDRFISISDAPPKFMGVYETMNGLMFYMPRAHLDRNEKEWQQVMQLASVLIIASLLVRNQSTCLIKILPNIALFAGLGSLAGAYYLLNESQSLGDHAADASTYFQKREEHLYGVQKIAIINATPQGLLIWGFIFFIAAILF